MRKFRLLAIILFLTLSLSTNYYLLPTGYLPQANAQEEVTITTYYPSPSGSYRQLTTTDNTYLATDSGRVGIGTTNPGAKLEIIGSEDRPQLIIKANSTQSNTNPLLQLQKNNSSVLLSLHSDNSSNIFLGLNAGKSNTVTGSGWEGTENVFLGSQAGEYNTIGGQNVAVGQFALYQNAIGDDNVAVGISALQNNVASRNTAVGERALQFLNVYPGSQTANTAIGALALNQNTSGQDNTALGASAGGSLKTGSNNTYIGRASGFNNQSGNGNVFIGNSAGYNETGSDKLYIANSSGDPLIYGNFSTKRVGIGTTNPTAALEVGGGFKVAYSGTTVQNLAAGGTCNVITHNLGVTASYQLIMVTNGDYPANPFWVEGATKRDNDSFCVYAAAGNPGTLARFNWVIFVQ